MSRDLQLKIGYVSKHIKAVKMSDQYGDLAWIAPISDEADSCVILKEILFYFHKSMLQNPHYGQTLIFRTMNSWL